jgi:hypothetical protein
MRYGLLVLFMTLSTSVGGQEPIDPARQTFLHSVDEYVALHRQLEAPLPPEVVTADLERLFEPRKVLAAAVRAARADARQGDIFTPDIAQYVRAIMADALEKGGIEDMLATVEDENSVHVPARVNGDYPAGRSVAMMPPCVLAALPSLPPELHYAFIGRDLILWDMHAGLIVDFVPNAIPETT